MMNSLDANLGQANKPTRWLSTSTVALSIACVVILTVMGRVSHLCRDAYSTLNLPPSWHSTFLNWTQLGWTLPVALIVTSLLVLKDRSCVRSTVVRLNVAAFGLLLFLFLFWLVAVLSPVFVMRIPVN